MRIGASERAIERTGNHALMVQDYAVGHGRRFCADDVVICHTPEYVIITIYQLRAYALKHTRTRTQTHPLC